MRKKIRRWKKRISRRRKSMNKKKDEEVEVKED